MAERYQLRIDNLTNDYNLFKYDPEYRNTTFTQDRTSLDNFNSSLVAHAEAKAFEMYGNRDRHFTRQAYTEYICEVVDLVKQVSNSSVVIAAAWLSGAIDLEVENLANLYTIYGLQVAAILDTVGEMESSGNSYRDRIEEIRKWRYCGTQDAKTIKLAHLAVDLSTMPFYDRKYTETLICTTVDLVDGPLRDGNRYLVGRVQTAVDVALKIVNREKYTEVSGLTGLRKRGKSNKIDEERTRDDY